MDWLRRNWPDLLIGLALIAVIAGIVATLLTGGSFFPLGGGGTPTPNDRPPAVSSQPPATADGDADATDGPPGVAVLPPVGDATDDATGGLPPGAPSADVDETDDATVAPTATPPADTPAPEVGDDAAAATTDGPAVVPVAPPGDAAEPTTVAATTTEADGAGATPATARPTDSATGAAAPAANADLPTEPYRVSVGAFGDPANAQAQARRFRDAGYPVFVAAQDALSLVLVGPYDDEAQARRVADEIRAGDYGIDPVIYEFRPDGGDEGASAPATTEPDVADAAPAPVTGDAAQAPATSGAGTRLQVGAYADRASAAPQVDRLEDLGFAVGTLEEAGLVKLVVGPFEGAALADARTVLNGAGIEFFAR